MLTQVTKKTRTPEELFSREPVNNFAPLVLIADDDPDGREMLRFLLETWNFCVVEATDGAEAVSIAEAEAPDLILLDAKMPRLDGFEATAQIRRSWKIADVPIFFISGCAEKIYRDAASAAGANEYLVKPLNFAELEKAIDKYVRRPPPPPPVSMEKAYEHFSI